MAPHTFPSRHKISAYFSAADTCARAHTHTLPSNQGLRIGRRQRKRPCIHGLGTRGEGGRRKKAEPGICRGKNNRLPKIPLTHPKADKQKYYCFVALVIIIFFCPFLVDQEAPWQLLIKSLPCNDGHRLQHGTSMTSGNTVRMHHHFPFLLDFTLLILDNKASRPKLIELIRTFQIERLVLWDLLDPLLDIDEVIR